MSWEDELKAKFLEWGTVLMEDEFEWLRQHIKSLLKEQREICAELYLETMIEIQKVLTIGSIDKKELQEKYRKCKAYQDFINASEPTGKK